MAASSARSRLEARRWSRAASARPVLKVATSRARWNHDTVCVWDTCRGRGERRRSGGGPSRRMRRQPPARGTMVTALAGSSWQGSIPSPGGSCAGRGGSGGDEGGGDCGGEGGGDGGGGGGRDGCRAVAATVAATAVAAAIAATVRKGGDWYGGGGGEGPKSGWRGVARVVAERVVVERVGEEVVVAQEAGGATAAPIDIAWPCASMNASASDRADLPRGATPRRAAAAAPAAVASTAPTAAPAAGRSGEAGRVICPALGRRALPPSHLTVLLNLNGILSR